LDAQALPRHASAYSSIDALILDASVLAALDSRQLGALLEYAATCGRLVLVNPDSRPRQVLESAAGCGGHALLTATTPAQAIERLKTSLRVPVAAPASLGGLGDLGRFDDSNWHRVMVLLSVYFALALLAVMFVSSMWVLLVPAAATLVVWFTLYGMQPESQVLVWGEAESGSRSATYQAWQQFAGLARNHARVPVPPELGSVRPCDSSRPVRFEFDGVRQVMTSAEFDTRLFQRVLLCYSGHFQAMREIVIDTSANGALDVRNAGTHPWPSGVLVTGRSTHELPSLAPNEKKRVLIGAGISQPDAVGRAALARTPVGHQAALWKHAVGSARDSSVASTTWLLVSVPSP
ncbi:MAG TPA: hypothetical protein VFI62_08150, partial [Burkholderiales bacterium]|nr:hypothetical protein [Burkholderiales bacterium]